MSRVEHFQAELSVDGLGTATIGIEIDVAGLIRELGERAMRNKGKRASEIGGLIKAQAVNVRRSDQ